MAIPALPPLYRASLTFRADVNAFFGTYLPATSAAMEVARVQIEDNVVSSTTLLALTAAKTLEAGNAAISASSAALAAGAVVWVSGLTYAAGDTRYSPIDYMSYRRKITGAGTLDPSLDSTNWAPAVSGFVTLSGAETLTNKKISAIHYIDRSVTIAAATGTVTLDLDQGSVFDLTLTGNTTLALANVPALTDETLNIPISVSQGATAYSLTWFGGIDWITVGGIEPSAPAANKTVEYLITTKAAGAYKGRKGAAT